MPGAGSGGGLVAQMSLRMEVSARRAARVTVEGTRNLTGRSRGGPLWG